MIQLCKKTGGVPNGAAHRPDPLGRSRDARQLPKARQTERIIDIAAVMEDCAPGPNHRKTMESLRKTQNVDRLARATAVSRRQVPTIQTVQKSLKMLTEFKPFTQVPACVGDHEVSVDAFAEWLKAISEGGQRNRPV